MFAAQLLPSITSAKEQRSSVVSNRKFSDPQSPYDLDLTQAANKMQLPTRSNTDLTRMLFISDFKKRFSWPLTHPQLDLLRQPLVVFAQVGVLRFDADVQVQF